MLLIRMSTSPAAANRDYCTTLLTLLAEEFKVSYSAISLLPTLAGLGVICGVFLVCPAGDVWRRRPLLLASGESKMMTTFLRPSFEASNRLLRVFTQSPLLWRAILLKR